MLPPTLLLRGDFSHHRCPTAAHPAAMPATMTTRSAPMSCLQSDRARPAHNWRLRLHHRCSPSRGGSFRPIEPVRRFAALQLFAVRIQRQKLDAGNPAAATRPASADRRSPRPPFSRKGWIQDSSLANWSANPADLFVDAPGPALGALQTSPAPWPPCIRVDAAIRPRAPLFRQTNIQFKHLLSQKIDRGRRAPPPVNSTPPLIRRNNPCWSRSARMS